MMLVRTFIGAWILLLLGVAPTPSRAEVALPTVDFIGEGRVCDGEKKNCSSLTIYYTPERWRLDTQYDSRSPSSMYFDVKSATITSLWHEMKLVMVLKLDLRHENALLIMPFLWGSILKVDQDQVDRIERNDTLTKYRFKNGDILWLTHDKIIARIENDAIFFEASRIAVGPFDRKLIVLTIPDGYRQ